MGDEPLDEADVDHRARHHVADGVAAEELGPHALQVGVELLAQVERDQEAGAAHRHARERDHPEAGQHHGHDAEGGRREPALAGLQPVDADHEQQRHQGFQDARQRERGDAADQPPAVLGDENA